MAKVDLRSMSGKEMKALRARLDKAIANKEKQARGTVLKKVEAVAKAAGYNLKDLIAVKAPTTNKIKRRKLAPKYRHPEDSQITWSGVGRKPKWIVEAEVTGSLNKLAV